MYFFKLCHSLATRCRIPKLWGSSSTKYHPPQLLDFPCANLDHNHNVDHFTMNFTTCRCTCGFTTSNRKSLSRHKQACQKVLFDVHKNLNVLESRVTTGVIGSRTDAVDGIRSNIAGVDVYDLDDYEVASLTDIEKDNVSDADWGNYFDED